MSKKDYIAIANSIARESSNFTEAMGVIDIISPGLSEAGGLDNNGNRKFDRDRFTDWVKSQWDREGRH